MRLPLKHCDQWRERPLAYFAPKRNAPVRNFSLRMPILYQKLPTIYKYYLRRRERGTGNGVECCQCENVANCQIQLSPKRRDGVIAPYQRRRKREIKTGNRERGMAEWSRRNCRNAAIFMHMRGFFHSYAKISHTHAPLSRLPCIPRIQWLKIGGGRGAISPTKSRSLDCEGNGAGLPSGAG